MKKYLVGRGWIEYVKVGSCYEERTTGASYIECSTIDEAYEEYEDIDIVDMWHDGIIKSCSAFKAIELVDEESGDYEVINFEMYGGDE